MSLLSLGGTVRYVPCIGLITLPFAKNRQRPQTLTVIIAMPEAHTHMPMHHAHHISRSEPPLPSLQAPKPLTAF